MSGSATYWTTVQQCLLDVLWSITMEYVSFAERIMLANTIPFLNTTYPLSITHLDLHELIKDGHLNVLKWMANLTTPDVFFGPRTAFTAWSYLPPPFKHAARNEQGPHVSTLTIHNGMVVMHYIKSLWTVPSQKFPHCPRPTAFTTATSTCPIDKQVISEAKRLSPSTIFVETAPSDSLQFDLLTTAAFCDRTEIFDWLYATFKRDLTFAEIYTIAQVASLNVLNVAYTRTSLQNRNYLQVMDVRECCQWRHPSNFQVIKDWFAAIGNTRWSTPQQPNPPHLTNSDDDLNDDLYDDPYEQKLDHEWMELWSDYYCGR